MQARIKLQLRRLENFSVDTFKRYSCLVGVRYEGQDESLFVDCVEDEKGWYLLLPLKHFPRHLHGDSTGLHVIRLRPQDVLDSRHPEFDLKYRYVLDLDGELPSGRTES